MDAIWIDQGQSSSSVDKTCLSPISLIELYVPEPVKKTQQNPIYRSRRATNERDSRSVAQHEHDDVHHNDESSQTATEFNPANVQITPDTFLSLCPALLVQIEQGSCNERYNERSDADPIVQPREEKDTQHIGKQSSCTWTLFFLSWPRPHRAKRLSLFQIGHRSLWYNSKL